MPCQGRGANVLAGALGAALSSGMPIGVTDADGGDDVRALVMWRRLVGLAILALLPFGAGCAGTGHWATPSLPEAKRQVGEYVDSGRYEADIAAVAEKARTYLESRAHRGGKLAIVVDLDETALSNLPSLRANDYGFIGAGPCDLPRGPCGLAAWIMM